jgi:DNA (cytosine-5)-methyltransferase 1
MTATPHTAPGGSSQNPATSRADAGQPPARAFIPKLRVLDLFSGIGGFSLGLERTGGFETAAFCEIEQFPRKVLAKHWPGVPCYDDVRTLTGARLAADGITGINVITGGFPCQDLSVAGKQRGMGEGTRSGLWSEIVRLVGELRPEFVIVENVAALLSGPSERRGGWFGRVLGDLAECGYDVEWRNIPAAMVGAPHRRERVWILANAKEMFSNGRNDHARKFVEAWPLSQLGDGSWSQDVANAAEVGQSGSGQSRLPRNPASGADWKAVDVVASRIGDFWRVEPDVGRVANGVPARLDRLSALGNAVVPQIPELIGLAILNSRLTGQSARGGSAADDLTNGFELDPRPPARTGANRETPGEIIHSQRPSPA